MPSPSPSASPSAALLLRAAWCTEGRRVCPACGARACQSSPLPRGWLPHCVQRAVLGVPYDLPSKTTPAELQQVCATHRSISSRPAGRGPADKPGY
jgi:hypothetical protein